MCRTDPLAGRMQLRIGAGPRKTPSASLANYCKGREEKRREEKRREEKRRKGKGREGKGREGKGGSNLLLTCLNEGRKRHERVTDRELHANLCERQFRNKSIETRFTHDS